MWKLTIMQEKETEFGPVMDKVEFVSDALKPLVWIIESLGNFDVPVKTSYRLESISTDEESRKVDE